MPLQQFILWTEHMKHCSGCRNWNEHGEGHPCKSGMLYLVRLRIDAPIIRRIARAEIFLESVHDIVDRVLAKYGYPIDNDNEQHEVKQTIKKSLSEALKKKKRRKKKIFLLQKGEHHAD